MVAAVLPLYLTAQVGLGLLAYGFVDGLYQGVSALVRIAGGCRRPRQPPEMGRRQSDTRCRRSAASRCSRRHGFAAITGVITADRLGKGLRTAPRDALIADGPEPASSAGRSACTAPSTRSAPRSARWWHSPCWPPCRGSYSSVFVVSFAFAVCGVAVIVLFVT